MTDSHPKTPTKKKRKPERDDKEPCYVAKMSCGHYVGAVVADGDDIAEYLREWREAGLIIETKTVGFVRDGGLTFCKCKTWERAIARQAKGDDLDAD